MQIVAIIVSVYSRIGDTFEISTVSLSLSLSHDLNSTTQSGICTNTICSIGKWRNQRVQRRKRNVCGFLNGGGDWRRRRTRKVVLHLLGSGMNPRDFVTAK